jgi:hypothetical protein
MSARETAELLLLVGRLVQAEGYDGELSPAQWMALRFFARANSSRLITETCVMLFARRKTYVRRARSMSTEQNRHTRSRSVVLNEEGKRRYNLLVSALAGMSTRIVEDEHGRHAAFDPDSARRLCCCRDRRRAAVFGRGDGL